MLALFKVRCQKQESKPKICQKNYVNCTEFCAVKTPNSLDIGHIFKNEKLNLSIIYIRFNKRDVPMTKSVRKGNYLEFDHKR